MPFQSVADGGEFGQLRGGQATVAPGGRGPGGIWEGGEGVVRQHGPGGIEEVAVRHHGAGDHGLAGAPARLDDHAVPASGHRVRGEEHARGVRLRHVLDHDGEGQRLVVEAVDLPVPHRALRPQGGPAAAYRLHHRLRAGDVEEGVLLAGEAGVGQVLGGGGRPDRDRYGLPAAEPGVRLGDGRAEVRGHRGGEDRLPHLLGPPRGPLTVAGIPVAGIPVAGILVDGIRLDGWAGERG